MRQAVFAAIRLLSIFIAVRSLPGLLFAIDRGWQQDFHEWLPVVSEGAPAIAAIVMWLGARWFAVQCTGGEILTMSELRLLVDHKVGGADDEPVSEAPERLRPLFVVGLALLGVFMIVDAIAPAVGGLLRFAFSKQVSFVCVPGVAFSDATPCEFWNPDSIQALITAVARGLEISVGLWLIVRPERAYELIERIRRRGIPAGESETLES